jgi:hypothetical protein
MTSPNTVPSPLNLPNKKVSETYPNSSWHRAYMAALFETDRSQLPERIRYAAKMILKREHELLGVNADPHEQRALNNALNALRTLQNYAEVKAG